MPNICGFSVWDILRATILVCSILSCFLDLCSFAILYGDADEEKDYIVCVKKRWFWPRHTKRSWRTQCHSPIVSVRETAVECSKAADTLMLWCVIGQQMEEVTHEREWSWWAAPCILDTIQKTAMRRRTTRTMYDTTTITVTNGAGSTRRAALPVPLVPPVPPVPPAPSIVNIRTWLPG